MCQTHVVAMSLKSSQNIIYVAQVTIPRPLNTVQRSSTTSTRRTRRRRPLASTRTKRRPKRRRRRTTTTTSAAMTRPLTKAKQPQRICKNSFNRFVLILNWGHQRREHSPLAEVSLYGWSPIVQVWI